MVVIGKIMDVINISDTTTQVVIRIKKDEIYLPTAFVCFQDMKTLVSQLRLEKGDFVKITYYLKSKKFKDVYYTSAIAEKISITQRATKQYSVNMFTGDIID